jgi:AraC-like DNA-binding protein/quercetin dioxygenase-like cupin family protein
MRASYEKVPLHGERFFYVKTRDDPEFEFKWHYHPEFELTLITESAGRRFVGDHIGDYEAGDLVLVGPNLPHTWCSFPEDKGAHHRAVVVQFPGEFLGPRRLENEGLARLRRLYRRAALGLAVGGRTRRELGARVERLPGLATLKQLAELILILDALSASAEVEELSSRTFEPEFGPDAPDAKHPVDRVCRYLNQRFRERVSLREAARVAAMSPWAFSRFFHRSTGKTLTTYVNELRVGEACRLLMDTDRGIADIAGAAGFPNLSNFNRQFLRFRGLRPSEYRREHRRYAATARPATG